MTQLKPGPQFPAADYHSIRQEGAKNHRVKISCGAVYIGTYNVRSLLGEDRLMALQEELANIKWHVIGLAETRRRGEAIEQLKSGHVLYTVGKDNKSEGGVGFLIHKDLAANVTEYTSASDRVVMVVIQLSKKYSVKVIQVYAPTSAHGDDEIEEMYDAINTLMDKTHTQYTMIIGDFNAKIGRRQSHESTIMGKYGTGHRNERGDRLLEFARSRNMYICNGKFQKNEKQLWTWKSPDGLTKNEIDFIMTSRRDTVTDVTIMNKVNIGSDHRFVRSKVMFNTKIERLKLTSKVKPAVNIRELHTQKGEFQLQLSNKFKLLEDENVHEYAINDVTSYNNKLTEIILDTAYSIAGFRQKRKQASKISNNTKELLKKRREMKPMLSKHGNVEYAELCKTIRKQMRNEIRNYNVSVVEKAISENKGLKAAIKSLHNRKHIVALKAEDGTIIRDRNKIVERCAEFYSKLYSSKCARPISQRSLDNVKPVLVSEVELAMHHMKNNKAPGEDAIVVEILKEGGHTVAKHLARLFTSCIVNRTVPVTWNKAIIVLLHKKGDIKDINNYRPISLISHTSKLFSRVLLNRIERNLDDNQGREQAGFRKGFSTTDHLHVISQLVEKCSEFSIPLCLTFVDYEKAFDSVEHLSVIDAIGNHGVATEYTELLTTIYNSATSKIRLDRDSKDFRIERGVRQGDTISPKLFNAALEHVFRQLDWEHVGVVVNGERINHLRFADDIVLISSNAAEMEQMLNQLNNKSLNIGLRMNMKKTKVMFNEYCKEHPLHVDQTTVEHVQDYVYLGQLVTMQSDKTPEIKRRIAAGWGAFSKYRDIMQSKIPMCLKRKVYHQCIQAVMTYGCQTWALTKRMRDKLCTTQRSMERAMLGISRLDKQTNPSIRQQTGLQDIIIRIKQLKWQWAGHVARITDNRWTKNITEWVPLEGKRKRARPKTRWEDEIVQAEGVTWARVAQDRKMWKCHEEAFIQQWI